MAYRMSRLESGMEAACRYEEWYETGFGRRADYVERRLLSRYLSEFGSARSLLEVGSGTGHFADLWAGAGLDATGIDMAPDRLAFSRRHRPTFPVIRGDALTLPFRERSFDIVALITALEFVSSPVAALEEAARVARQGLLIGALNRWSLVAWWRRLRAAQSYRGARFFTSRELQRLVRRLHERKPTLQWRTRLYPFPWLDGIGALPFGAFVMMSVRFREESA